MAAFNKDSFGITYRLEGQGDDDVSLITWGMDEPFPVPQYGPCGGMFVATVIQRRNGRYNPWFFIPQVTMIHKAPAYDGVVYDNPNYHEPKDSLPVEHSFDDAIEAIKDYVRRKIVTRKWDGAAPDEPWWTRPD